MMPKMFMMKDVGYGDDGCKKKGVKTVQQIFEKE